MPLFDLNPKETPGQLFGREGELAELVRLVNARRWVVVLGPRMVGKTSLIRAASRRVDRPSVYVNLWGARGTLGFVHAFVHGLNSSRSLMVKIRRALSRLEGISVGTQGISLSAPPRPLRTVWDLLDTIGRDAGRSVIAFDEVQEVAAASGTLLRVLANSFNSHPEVVFVFTGSRYGLVRALLDPPTGSPLFGRSPATIELHPFTPERSLEFLERGLREYHRTVDRDQLRAVIDRSLDGVPGWLTLFGSHLALQRLSVEKAEELTVAEARKVVRGELAHFLKGRERGTHWDALRLMVSGASWTEIRDGLAARRGSPVNDNTVRNVVRNLSAAGLVEKVDDRYVLPDPMVRGYVRSLARPPEPRPEDERRRSASAD